MHIGMGAVGIRASEIGTEYMNGDRCSKRHIKSWTAAHKSFKQRERLIHVLSVSALLNAIVCYIFSPQEN